MFVLRISFLYVSALEILARRDYLDKADMNVRFHS